MSVRADQFSALEQEVLDYVKALAQEVQDWRECAMYDALMSGPKFKGWNRSALDRCRQRYIEK